jgi:hypothetical protein
MTQKFSKKTKYQSSYIYIFIFTVIILKFLYEGQSKSSRNGDIAL